MLFCTVLMEVKSESLRHIGTESGLEGVRADSMTSLPA